MRKRSIDKLIQLPLTPLRFELASKLLNMGNAGKPPANILKDLGRVKKRFEKTDLSPVQLQELDALADEVSAAVSESRPFADTLEELIYQMESLSASKVVTEELKFFVEQRVQEWRENIFPFKELERFYDRLKESVKEESLDGAWRNAQEAISRGYAPRDIMMETPAKQLIWGAHVLYLLYNPEQFHRWPKGKGGKNFEKTQLWRQLLNSHNVKYLRALFGSHIFNLLRKNDILIGWGAPGSWFYYKISPPPGRIYGDLLYSMIVGFDHARACMVHEISHAVQTKGVPEKIKQLSARIKELEVQVNANVATNEEKIALEMASLERTYRRHFLNAAEDNCVNRFTENIGQIFGQDYGYSLNYFYTAAGDVGRRFSGTENPYPEDSSVNRFRNLCYIVSRVFLANNGLFPNTPAGWRSIKAKTNWIAGRDKNDPETTIIGDKAFSQLIDLCEEVEYCFPPVREMAGGPQRYEEKAVESTAKRFGLIEEIYQLYADPIVQKMLDERKKQMEKELEDKEEEEPPTPPDQPTPPEEDTEEENDNSDGGGGGGGDDPDPNPDSDNERPGEELPPQPQEDSDSSDDDDTETVEEEVEADSEEGEENEEAEKEEQEAEEGDQAEEEQDAAEGEEEAAEESMEGDEGAADDRSGGSEGADERDAAEEEGESEEGQEEEVEEVPEPENEMEMVPESEESGEEEGEELPEIVPPDDPDEDEELEEYNVEQQIETEEVEDETEADMVVEDEEQEPELKEMDEAQEADEQRGDEDADGGEDSGDGGGDSADVRDTSFFPHEELASIGDLREALQQAAMQEEQTEEEEQPREHDPHQPEQQYQPNFSPLEPMDLDDLAQGSWDDFARRVAMHAPIIAMMAGALKRLKEAQLKVIYRISKKHRLTPPGGDLRRFDPKRADALFKKLSAKEKIEKDDLDMFFKDRKKAAATRPSRVILIDGSRSMSMGKAPLPMDKAIQEAVIDYKASEIAGYDTFIVMYGPWNPIVIAEPGDNPIRIGKNIEQVRGGLNTATHVAPGILQTIKLIAERKKFEEPYVGFTNFVIYSDGDIDDPRQTKELIQQIVQFAPKTTFDFVLITSRKRTPMDDMLLRMQFDHPINQIGVVRGDASRKYPMALTATYVLTNRLRSMKSSFADPSFKRSSQFRRLLKHLLQNRN